MRPLPLLALILSTAPAAEPTKGVDIKLVADVTCIAPATPFTVALHIRHHEGYHTYWKAPGIVGLPTGLKWDLPDGFEASPIAWPAPEFTHMFHYLAYGYENDALLLTTITPPASLPAKAELKVRATWMACAETCHPGTRILSIALPATQAPKPDPEWQPKIAAAKRSVPRSLTSLTEATASRSRDAITLAFTPPKGVPVSQLHFLSDHNLFDPNTSQVQSVGSLKLTLMPDAPKPLPSRLTGLLYNPAGWPSLDGAKFGRIDLPLANH